MLLIGLVGCSRDRGELALKKTPTLIDEDACENREPKALAVVEMAETMGRVPIHPSHGENDCPENLRVGEQDTDDILLVGASRPALVFITPSLSPMPIMPPPSSLPEQVPMRQKPSPPLPADAPGHAAAADNRARDTAQRPRAATCRDAAAAYRGTAAIITA